MLLILGVSLAATSSVKETILHNAQKHNFHTWRTTNERKRKKGQIKTLHILDGCGNDFCRIATHVMFDCNTDSYCRSHFKHLKGEFELECGNSNGGPGWKSHDVCNVFRKGAGCTDPKTDTHDRQPLAPVVPTPTVCWPKYNDHPGFSCKSDADCGRAGANPEWGCDKITAHYQCKTSKGFSLEWARLHDRYGEMTCGAKNSCPWKNGRRCCVPKDQVRCEYCKFGTCKEKALIHPDAKCRWSTTYEKGTGYYCDVTDIGCPKGKSCLFMHPNLGAFRDIPFPSPSPVARKREYYVDTNKDCVH